MTSLIAINKCRMVQAKIFHRRLFPKLNKFGYELFYVALPLSKLEGLNIWPLFGINRPALMSFWSKDHGDRAGGELRAWAEGLLLANQIDDVDGEIVLLTLPRLLGYVFNPVSFWMCYRANGDLRAVIAEVNNTFGETHSYVCVKEDSTAISEADFFFAEKQFHVSPFLHREGHYRFRFDNSADKFSAQIDYFDRRNCLQLQTSMSGSYLDWNCKNLLAGWLRSPLMAMKASMLIHWQAVKLLFKSAGFKAKPAPHQWMQTRATTDKGVIYKEENNRLVQEETSCI